MSNKSDGFTLVEFILTIFIIGIIAVFVLPLFADIFGSIFSARDKTRATFAAQRLVVEKILKSEDENSEIIENIDLVAEDGTPIIEDLKIEKRMGTKEYNLPQNITQDLIIDYYIYLPESP
ncbi:MAG: prepilin-type N-terminal cleavage/methylation domain-containing protein [Halanaerobium sp.]